MDIKNLAYILEAYKCRSINKAAQNVYISQSHLSSIIKNVESEIGYAVFIRTPSGLTYQFACRVSGSADDSYFNHFYNIYWILLV